MNIMIADDEGLARSTLKSQLLELNLPIQITGEASNGEELIDLIKRDSPDIIFVDISMPKMNGLEAIKQGKLISPLSKWFVLSGYSEFSYAQEAIRLGITNYLLKPVDQQTLLNCLHEVMLDHNNYIHTLNDEFEYLLSSFILGTRSLDDLLESLPFRLFHFTGVILCADSSLSQPLKLQLIKKFMQNMQSFINKEMTFKELRLCKITLRNGYYAIVAACDPQHSSKINHAISTLMQYIEQTINEHKTNYFSFTAIQTELCENIEQLIHQFDEIQRIKAIRALLPSSSLWTFKELTNYKTQYENLFNLSILLDRIISLYQENDYLNFMKELDNLETELKTLSIYHQQIRVHICDFLNGSLNCSLLPSQDLESWINTLKKLSEKMLALTSKKGSTTGDLVQQMIHYVENYYMNDIGINQIANELNVTPNYISSLFHKKRNITFSKYLTQTRMLKAKQLLIEDSAAKVFEIGKQVGYYSISHFIRVFNEFHGCSPTQMREKHHSV